MATTTPGDSDNRQRLITLETLMTRH